MDMNIDEINFIIFMSIKEYAYFFAPVINDGKKSSLFYYKISLYLNSQKKGSVYLVLNTPDGRVFPSSLVEIYD